MIRINHRVASLLLAGALTASASIAQALEEQRYGETAYITGGVGEDEQLALKDRASQYTLRVMIARKGSGEFLSDCRITVTRGTTTALEATMDGKPVLAKAFAISVWQKSAVRRRWQLMERVLSGQCDDETLPVAVRSMQLWR